MAGPFYNNIKGTTAGTPGTGAFTPNAASSGALAWTTSNVPSGWMGLVRYEDGSAWELCYSYWNGTTLTRAASQIPHTPSGALQTSTGSQLTLSSSATAELVADGNELQGHFAGYTPRGWFAQAGQTSLTALGVVNGTTVGTASAAVMAATNYLTEQPRIQWASANTASAQAGYTYGTIIAVASTTAGRGGYEQTARWGATQLPTGPRLFVGMVQTTLTMVGTTEPSALATNVAGFAKDSTDTNIQLLTNATATTAGTKVDTGIPWVANGWYESTTIMEPGSNRVHGLLFRLDTGAVWCGSTATDVPVTGSLLVPQIIAGLNAVNTGTALNFQFGQMLIRSVA